MIAAFSSAPIGPSFAARCAWEPNAYVSTAKIRDRIAASGRDRRRPVHIRGRGRCRADGSTCSMATTADSLVPGTIEEGNRSIWEIGQIEVEDGGPDGLASTGGDNTPFARQELFVP